MQTRYKLLLFASFFASLCLFSVFTASPVEPAPRNPVLYFQSWTQYNSMPYDQGIDKIYLEGNGTGAYWFSVATIEYDGDSVYEVNASQVYRIVVRVTLNKTYLDYGGGLDYRNYIRANVTVTNETGTQAYFKQNCTEFTDYDAIGANIYYADMLFVLNFETDYGQKYNVSLCYDVCPVQSEVPVYTDWYYTDFSNTTWNPTGNDRLYATQPVGTVVKYIKNDGLETDLGTVKDDTPATTIPVNSWLYYTITQFYDYAGSNDHIYLQMHIGGSWRYYLGGDHYEGTAIGTHYYNMSAWAGMSLEYVIFSFAYFDIDDYATFDEFHIYTNTTTETRGWETTQSVYFEEVTPVFTGWFDPWIVLLGLCLIPISTIYLAANKNDMDSDKLMFGLVLMVVGWALFFGGLI